MGEQREADAVEQSIEHLFDALEDLNRVQKRRANLRDSDDVLDSEREEQLKEFWKPADEAQLQFALQRIDTARDLVADELDRLDSDE